MQRLALIGCALTLLLVPATAWSQDDDWESTEPPSEETETAAPAPAPKPAPKPAAADQGPATAAERVAGRVGVGFHTSAAPLGVRYWISDLVALDFGFGMWLDERDDTVSSEADDTTITCDFAMELGAPVAVASYENLIIFARPGVQIVREYDVGTRKNGDDKHDDDVRLELNAQLGAEIFLGALGFPNISFQGGVGVAFAWYWPADDQGETDANFNMESLHSDLGIVINARLGFHIYF